MNLVLIHSCNNRLFPLYTLLVTTMKTNPFNIYVGETAPLFICFCDHTFQGTIHNSGTHHIINSYSISLLACVNFPVKFLK